MILQIGAHQKRQNVLKLHLFYVTMSCRDEITFQTLRKSILYTTRAIESGVMPKVLQKLLGHVSIKTTMDRYVHVIDASLTQAVLQFQSGTRLAS